MNPLFYLSPYFLLQLWDVVRNNFKFKDLWYFQTWKENSICLAWIAVPMSMLDYQVAIPIMILTLAVDLFGLTVNCKMVLLVPSNPPKKQRFFFQNFCPSLLKEVKSKKWGRFIPLIGQFYFDTLPLLFEFNFFL